MRSLILILIIALVGCENKPTKQSAPAKKKPRIVKDKRQAQETSYEYKYNFWKGDFYHVPDIHSVYYLVYTDGSYDRVDIGRFSITNIGDTINAPSL